MSIGKKILSTVTHILVICILIFALTFLITFSGLRYQIQTQNDNLNATIIDKAQNSYQTLSETLVYEYTHMFVKQINYKVALLYTNIDDIAQFAQELYEDKNIYSIADDYMLMPEVAESSVYSELSYISPVEFLLDQHNSSVFEGSKIYYCSDSGFALNLPLESDSKTLEYNLRERPWYEVCKNTNNIMWSDPYYDLLTGQTVITCSKGVFGENGEFYGAIAIDFTQSSLIDQNIADNSFDENKFLTEQSFSNYIVVDSSGNIILSSFDIGDEYNNISSKCISNEDDDNVFTYNDWIIGCSDINIKDWKICFIVDSTFTSNHLSYINASIDDYNKLLDKHFNNIIFIFGIASVLIVVSMFAVSVYFSRKLAKSITMPLDELSHGIKLIGVGELDHRIDVGENTELSELADVINNVSLSLKESMLKLIVESAQNQQILSELELGKAVQLRMLPEEIECENIDIEAFMQPAKYIGGDFYDYFYTDSKKLAFIIGDVSGKGVAAALFMSYVKGVIKLTAKSAKSPSDVFQKVNSDILETNYDCTFVTAVLGFIDPITYELEYCIAGHLPPLYKRKKKVFRIPSVKSLPLGVIETVEYKTLRLKMERDDMLVLYTDGISDTTSLSGDCFGEKSIIKCISEKDYKSSEELCSSILYKAISFSEKQEQFDDITLAVLRIRNEHYHIKISNNVEDLSKLLNKTDEYLKSLNTENSYYVLLIVEELVTNIIEHGTKSKCNIELWIEIFSDDTKITVIDESFEFNPLILKEPDVTLSVNERKIGGLGIYLIKKLSKEMKYKRIDNKNINTIIL